ncbi:hypothetical protein DITRI_Ditri03aG0200300 [Diplodiscus trichospermus]
MDPFHLLPANSVVIGTIFALPIFLFSLIWLSKSAFGNRNKKRSVPEAGGSWPVIGHLHLLGGPSPPHIVITDMAKKYGPMFTLKMGVHKALVVNDHETVKECLTKNDKAFATRPTTIAMEFLSYNFAMFAFAPYGAYWRQMRKLTTLELLSNYRLERLAQVRQSEVHTSVQELYQLWKDKKDSSDKLLVEMKDWFKKVTLNVILRMIAGKRIPSSGKDAESEKWIQALKQFFELVGKFVISDALPYLRWMDIGGHERSLKKVREELDEVVQGWLEDHKRKRSASADKLNSDEDFMDLMLSIPFDEGKHDADTINKATCLTLILGASDTTMVTLTWALSLLLNNRHALKKAQEELDIHVGRDKPVEESDIKKLVYLQAIVKETLRLYPAGPLLVGHVSTEDCDMSGYHIPAGTRLFINLYKIHRDPRVWSDPYEFQPERFLTTHKDFDVRGQNFELIPFGAGRRVCPGISLALHMMELTLASLLQGFEIGTPSDGPVDMSEAIGLTNLKPTPLQVFLTPRLPASCY